MRIRKWALSVSLAVCLATVAIALQTQTQGQGQGQGAPCQVASGTYSDAARVSESVVWETIAPSPGEKGGVDLSGPYEPVPNWPQPLHADYSWGHTDAIWAESPDRVFVVQQAELPVLEEPEIYGGLPARRSTGNPDSRVDEHILMVLDRNGRVTETWKHPERPFLHVHSLKMDPYDSQRHLWVVDDSAQSIYKFTNDGKLVMTLGEFKVSASDKTHFGGPTDIAFLPNGDFYVSDGYRNSRIVKFSKDGKYLAEWGKRGTAQGELILPHSITIDARQRIYVADRQNSRIQVFDVNGKYLDHWPNIPKATYISISKDQYLWAVDCRVNKLLKYDLNGRLLDSWGTFGGRPGELWCVHNFNVDSEGNLYTAEVYGGRPQKFRARTGANPAELIGSLLDGSTR